VVEGLPDLTEALIEEHEEAALIGAIGCGVVGLLSLIVLIIGRSKSRRGAATIAVIAALAVSGWLVYTASLGGQIRHTELRATSSTSSTSGGFIPKPGRSGFSCTPPAFPSNATFYV
jgi:hypothetical protein